MPFYLTLPFLSSKEAFLRAGWCALRSDENGTSTCEPHVRESYYRNCPCEYRYATPFPCVEYNITPFFSIKTTVQ